jgi:hypothetical protein
MVKPTGLFTTSAVKEPTAELSHLTQCVNIQD